MAATRSAHTVWEGSLFKGSGVVAFDSSGAIAEQPVTWASRAEEANGKTSPEELIAAAHSACYAMSLSNEVEVAGGTPRTLEVVAEVSLGPDPTGGFRLTSIALTVAGDVEGLDSAGFEAAAEAAKVGCPVSKALTGVDITLNVSTR